MRPTPVAFGVIGGLLVVGVLVAPSGPAAWLRVAVVLLPAVAVILGVTRLRPPRPRPWWLLAGAMAAFVIESVWLILAGPGPAVDVLALAGYGLIVAAAVVFTRRLRPEGGRESTIDGAIVGIAVGSVLSVVLFTPGVPGSPDAATAHLIAGPLTMAAVAGVLTRFALSIPRGCPAAWLILAASGLSLLGNLVRTAAVSLGPGYAIGGATDALIVAAYPLLAVAAVHPSMTQLAGATPPTRPERGSLRLILLGVALLLPPAMLALEPPGLGRWVAVGAAALVNVLVVWRLAWLFAERERASAAMSEQLARDPLTGLANRRAFVGELERTRARCRREGTGLAVLFCDLDAFKPVNDRHGHAVGDAVLVEVARRLEGAIREGDVVARIAGDEFVVLLLGAEAEAAAGVEARIRRALAEPFDVDGLVVGVGVSVGVAHVEGRADVDAARDLVAEADRAMYRDKRGGALAT